MIPQITIESTMKRNDSVLAGFRYWWLKYVTAFDQRYHCARCLKGPYDERFHQKMEIGLVNELKPQEDSKFIYLCGVSYAGWANNFHLPMCIDTESEEQSFKTYNGFTIVTNGIQALPIDSLPDGWNDLPAQYTTCRNFQFGVQYFKQA